MAEFLRGIRVETNSLLTVNEIERPQDRFIEYGPEDDWWLLKYGFAKMVTKPSPTVYVVQAPVLPDFYMSPRSSYLVMHPDLWVKLKAEAERQGFLHASV